MLRIITDFDGPIMDVSERYYRVYQFCLEQTRKSDQELQHLTKSEFWQLKRARVPEYEIGQISGLTPEQAKQFAHLRRQTVHSLAYLAHDRLITTAISALEQAQKADVDLVILTMRRQRELDAACNHFDLTRFFPPERRYCLGNQTPRTTDVADKTHLMGQALTELPPASSTWMIGDTEADMVAAKTHGVPVIGVLSGIRDRPRLEQYRPDAIVEDLITAVERIVQNIPYATRSLPTLAPV